MTYLSIIFALSLLFFGAQSPVYAVDTNPSNFTDFENKILPVVNDGQWHFINTEGNPISKQNYSNVMVMVSMNNLSGKYVFFAFRNDKWYRISPTGNESQFNVPSGYKLSHVVSESTAVLVKGVEEKMIMRLFSIENSKLIGDEYLSIFAISLDGMIRVIANDDTNSDFYINIQDGSVAIPFVENRYVSLLGEHLASVTVGKEVKSRRTYLATVPDLQKVADIPSEIRFSGKYSEGLVQCAINHDAMKTLSKTSSGLVDAKGNLVCAGFENVSSPTCGLAKVAIRCDSDLKKKVFGGDCLYGYVGLDGTIRIECQYPKASIFVNNVAVVENDQQEYLVINKLGKQLKKINIDGILHFNPDQMITNGVILIGLRNGCKLKNIDGKTIWKSDKPDDFEQMKMISIYHNPASSVNIR
jgi:hypothetical protein